MLRADQANEELTLELQWLRKRVSELESFHTERPLGGETLQQIEAKAILESFEEGLLVLDRKGKLIDANKKFEEISGYQRSELVGKTTLSLARLLTNKGLSVYWKNPLNRTVDTTKAPHEIDIFKKNGGLVTVQTVCRELRDDDKVVGHLVILKDVTDRRRAERESNVSLEVYKSLVSHVGIGIFRATAGPAGRFLQVNHALEEITGYSREELLQMNVDDLYVHPEERAEHIKEVLSGTQTKAREVRFRKKDGTEIIVRDKKIAARSNDGKALYLEGFLEDITERKGVEQALQSSEQNLHNTLDGSPMGIYVIDANLNTLYANQALLDIFGYKNIDEIRVNPLDKHYTTESRVGLVQRRERYLRGEPNPDKFELDIVRSDSTIRHLQAYRKDILWDGKKQRQVIYHDITELRNAEEALKESEQNLRNFLDNSIMGVRVRQDGYIVFANQALLDIFGCENIDELRASPPEERYTPECYADFLLRKKKLANGEPISTKIEINIVRKDGTIRHLQVFGRQVISNGKTQTQTFYNDITESKEAEKQVRESEHNLKTYFENAPDGIYLSDLKGVFLYGNKKAEDLLGYDKEELVGKNFLELTLLPAKYLIRAGKLLALNAMGKNTGPDEFQLIKKDKTHVWVEINTTTIKQKDKKIILGFARDITERKKSDEKLRLEKDRAQTYLDIAAVMIVALDIDGKVTLINRRGCEILGYKADEILGRNWFTNFLPKTILNEVLSVWRKINAGEIEPLRQYENQVLTRDGQERTIAWNNVELRDAKGRIIGTLSSGEDITEREQAVKAMRESEEKYRLIVENSTDIIFTLNNRGEFVYLSPSVKKVLGYEQSDLLGRTFRSFVHAGDVYVIDKAEQSHNVYGVQPTVNDEYRFRDSSGEWRWFVSTGVPMREKHGEVFSFVGIARDITAQKRVESELKASEQNFRNSIDGSLMGIRITGDKEYILYANQALLDMFGYENIEELRASPPHEHYAPESYAGFIQRKEKYARGESIPDQLEIDTIRKDGSIRHLQLSSVKVIWNGKEQRQTLYNDVTERRQAENRLKEAAREWRTTFDSITDLISIHDKDNRIIRVNKAIADLLQTTPQELIGKSCREVMRGNQECPANCPQLIALKTGKPSSLEIFNPKLGVHFQESASPIFNNNGEITGTVLVARDVTQQKRMEEQLILTDRLASIGELSSGIAHELNNPLTSVIGFSQLLMEGDVPANMKEDRYCSQRSSACRGHS